MSIKAKPNAAELLRALRNYFQKHTYHTKNCYVFDWEADYLSVEAPQHYIVEAEVKISRADFKRDFKKDKHNLLLAHKKHVITKKTSIKTFLNNKQTSSGVLFLKTAHRIPNRFYFATLPGIIKPDELPPYAGLLVYEKGHFTKVKQAPILHKTCNFRRYHHKLFDKFYYRYLGSQRELSITKAELAKLKAKVSKINTPDQLINLQNYIQTQHPGTDNQIIYTIYQQILKQL